MDRKPFDEFWMPEPYSGCHLWIGGTRESGYGRFFSAELGRMTSAHRVAWERRNGPIPAGISVLHKCDTPLCVNPDHLFLGTHDDNMRDMRNKGRSCRGSKNHCVKLTEEQVRQIKAISKTYGISRKIAPLFGVSSRTIRDILDNTTWAWVS